jgi:hypothetical protein
MDHVFSGWSVWLEPERTESLDAELSYLQNSCGGPDHGVFPFVPHVTLLYNMDPSTISSLSSSSSSSSQEGLSPTSTETSHQYEQLLQQCWDQLLHWQKEQQQQQQQQQGQCNAANGPSDDSFTPTKKDYEDDTRRITTTIDDSLILLQPTGYHYLHYPKWADGGKGFGCSIAYLLFQQQQHQASSTTTTSWLDQLHSICRTVLGPAERTGFIPHMSLVYAPEAYGTLLQQHVANKQELERQQQQEQEPQKEESSIPSFLGARMQKIVGTKNNNHCTQNPYSSTSSREENGVWWLQPQRVAYLSLWSTEGRIQDWYPIAKIPIGSSSQSLSPPPSSLT